MTLGEQIRGLVREPLVHFLAAGLIVFMIASWRGGAVDPADRTITIDEDRVTWLVSQFEQTWQRSPSPAEIDQLIRDYVKEEVYYREALRMGLDQDDPVIRRRLRSKMEFLASSQVESTPASEADLQAWLKAHQAQYAEGTRYSFDQIYLGSADDPQLKAKAATLKRALAAGKDWRGLGQTISLPAQMTQADATAIGNEFGEDFAAALPRVTPGGWQGPIQSGFGAHLVRITQLVPGRVPPLSAVRQRVENDWREATLSDRQDRAYQALLDGYSVRIKKP